MYVFQKHFALDTTLAVNLTISLLCWQLAFEVGILYMQLTFKFVSYLLN